MHRAIRRDVDMFCGGPDLKFHISLRTKLLNITEYRCNATPFLWRASFCMTRRCKECSVLPVLLLGFARWSVENAVLCTLPELASVVGKTLLLLYTVVATQGQLLAEFLSGQQLTLVCFALR